MLYGPMHVMSGASKVGLGRRTSRGFAQGATERSAIGGGVGDIRVTNARDGGMPRGAPVLENANASVRKGAVRHSPRVLGEAHAPSTRRHNALRGVCTAT